jgi:hypothetical protein
VKRVDQRAEVLRQRDRERHRDLARQHAPRDARLELELGHEEHDQQLVGKRQQASVVRGVDHAQSAEDRRRDVVEVERSRGAGLGLAGGGEQRLGSEGAAAGGVQRGECGSDRRSARAEAARHRQVLVENEGERRQTRAEAVLESRLGAPNQVVLAPRRQTVGERAVAHQTALASFTRVGGTDLDHVTPERTVDRCDRGAQHVEPRRQVADAGGGVGTSRPHGDPARDSLRGVCHPASPGTSSRISASTAPAVTAGPAPYPAMTSGRGE